MGETRLWLLRSYLLNPPQVMASNGVMMLALLIAQCPLMASAEYGRDKVAWTAPARRAGSGGGNVTTGTTGSTGSTGHTLVSMSASVPTASQITCARLALGISIGVGMVILGG